MADSYTKMKPDSFKLQLQAVLTTFYEDIKGVQLRAPAVATRPGSSSPIRGPRGRHRARTLRTPATLPPDLSGRLGHVVLRGRLLSLMMMISIKLVCFNFNRRDTWQQPDPAYRPASMANKKLDQKDTSVYVHCSTMSVHCMKCM